MNIVSGFISNINTRLDRDITKYLKYGCELMAVEIPMTIFIERMVFDEHISSCIFSDESSNSYAHSPAKLPTSVSPENYLIPERRMSVGIDHSSLRNFPVGDRVYGEFVYRIRGGVMDGIQQKYSYVKVGHITFVFFELRDLFLWSYRALGHRFQLNTGNPTKDTIEYMMVQCQKSEWIAIASQLVDGIGLEYVKNSGELCSQEFVWIDFGAFHMFGGKIDIFQTELYKLRGRINRRLLHPIPERRMSVGIDQTGTGGSYRVTFARCWDPNHVYYGDIYRDVNWLFAGSVFGGGGDAMQKFALRVREKCLQVLRERNTLMWEINIWVLIYREAPELFALYPSDHSEILFRGYS